MATVTDPLFVLMVLSFAAGIVVGWVLCCTASSSETGQQEQSRKDKEPQ